MAGLARRTRKPASSHKRRQTDAYPHSKMHWSLNATFDEYRDTDEEDLSEHPGKTQRYAERRRIDYFKKVQDLRFSRIPEDVRIHIVESLAGVKHYEPEGDLTPLCEALQEYGPTLFLDPLILECLHKFWVAAPDATPRFWRNGPAYTERRDYLRQIGEALAYAPQKRGRKGFLSEERRAEINPLKKARSAAVTRWVKKFDACRKSLTSNEQAVKQVLMEFIDKCKVKDPQVKKMVWEDLIQKLRKLSNSEIVDRVLRELRRQRVT